MAERRMIAQTIVDSDAFLEMPQSTQNLYFHLSVRADDDGFINNPKKIMKVVGSGDDDLRILVSKKFILMFDTGVLVVKHWRIHNYIRIDRYKPTVYQEEMSQLAIKDNGAYTLDPSEEQPSLPEAVKEEKNEEVPAEALRLAELLRDLHKQKWDEKYNPTQKSIISWAVEIERLNRINRKSYEEIESVIRFVKNMPVRNNFSWATVILSGTKLRKHYDQLYVQSKASYRGRISNDEGAKLL